MPSPFPGMDPYLEAHWRDVHQRLIIYFADAIRPGLPSDLRPRVEERVFVQPAFGTPRTVFPDISVVKQPRHEYTAAAAQSGTAVAEPLVVRLPNEDITESYLEIIDVSTGGQVVTVIEVLSPTNRLPGPGRTQYVRKQQEMRDGGVNLVEIDLVRTGDWVLLIDEWAIPEHARTPNRASVWRASDPDQVEFYSFPLRQRLPAIRIPLRMTDDDVKLDLQPLLDKCYENAGYDSLDYSRECRPPLAGDEAEWARELLDNSGFRKS